MQHHRRAPPLLFEFGRKHLHLRLRLRYRTGADGQRFTVWSIGWNGTDDTAAGRKGHGDGNEDIALTTEFRP